MRFRTMECPLGRLLLAADAQGLREIRFPGPDGHAVPGDWTDDDGQLDDVEQQLREYLAGDRREFSLRLAPRGTEFQLRVWEALREIPYGTTVSYGQLARRLGAPGAARAVGLANGSNPIPVVIPCHRVIGADGSLTGYGGGLERKRLLLALEGGGVAAEQSALF